MRFISLRENPAGIILRLLVAVIFVLITATALLSISSPVQAEEVFLALFDDEPVPPSATVPTGEARDSARYEFLMRHIAYLADDEREGRGIGTAGLDSAAEYIRNYFKQNGLSPLFDSTYTQHLDMAWGVEVLPGCTLKKGEIELVPEVDFRPPGFTGLGEVTADAVFAGYGITAPEYDYDDYEKLDSDGKIVVILEGEPANDDPESRFEGTILSQHATLRNKAINARTHGATGLIIVRGQGNHGEAFDELPMLREDEPYRDVGIPALHVTNRGIERLLPEFRLADAQKSIDLNQAPRSMPVGREPLTMKVQVNRGSVRVKNIGAVLQGDERILVVGAHYDHLGYGQQGTTEPGVREIHNGADDNASGVAVMLEIAAELARKRGNVEQDTETGPTIWFIAFTGEEVGLVGSSFFVKHPPGLLNNVFFMLNLDMVGRMQDESLTCYGVSSATGLKDAATRANEGIGLNLSLTGGGFGPSDQTSFYLEGIPVLQLFTDAHFDYHSPRDDIEFINMTGLLKVYDYSHSLVDELSTPDLSLAYLESEQPTGRQSGGRGKRPSLGTIPDFSQPDTLRGVRIQGVKSGSPADKAGLQKGDILVRMDEIIIDNIYDFVFALDSRKPGDEVEIEFKRAGKLIRTSATLAQPAGGGGHGR